MARGEVPGDEWERRQMEHRKTCWLARQEGTEAAAVVFQRLDGRVSCRIV